MDKIKSGKIARFLPEVKQEIFERDGYRCIIEGCNNLGVDSHHVLFGTETIYDEARNTKKNGVTLCRLCHEECHGSRKGQGKRQEAIDYNKTIYDY